MPRLARSRDGYLVVGVAAGIAAHLGVPRVAVRAAFVVLVAFSGLGLILYAAFWAMLPERAADGTVGEARSLARLVPFLVIGAAIVGAQLVGEVPQLNLIAAILVAVIVGGAGMIWHQTDREQRRQWRAAVPGAPWLGVVVQESDRRLVALRFVGGAVLVAAGLIGVVAVYAPVGRFDVLTVLGGILFALVGVAGVALVAAPTLWRLFDRLRAEQAGRIREQERAEFAAMVHDRVLHTLALILRNADDPGTVRRLARGQERALRNWLYRPAGSPAERFGAALEALAAEVEDTYGIGVEAVVVGDAAVDDAVAALVAATREALVNAARHAGVPTVSLYAEVEPDELSVFVRDRGRGFDPGGVPDDRHGVQGSIIGRMRRHGGGAEVRSAPGDGTEVRLRLPHTAPAAAGDEGE
ncbi:putative two-component system sensor kinase [Pilimelia anulata]|uniref:Putative two-component system sensor kinase n=1 Tax=Pilimelia anulata TaxID=53371 RepID=A0A8J3B1L3_9ACTN|nr:putative two-component system sensor kinase [Pilimelia anulata]